MSGRQNLNGRWPSMEAILASFRIGRFSPDRLDDCSMSNGEKSGSFFFKEIQEG